MEFRNKFPMWKGLRITYALLELFITVNATDLNCPCYKCWETDGPVNADGHEMKNGRGAAHDVERDPHVTQSVAKPPLSVVHLHAPYTSHSLSIDSVPGWRLIMYRVLGFLWCLSCIKLWVAAIGQSSDGRRAATSKKPTTCILPSDVITHILIHYPEDCQLLTDIGRRSLRSADVLTCATIKENTYASRRQEFFSVAGPSLWNSMSVALCDRDISLERFKRLLKTLWFV